MESEGTHTLTNEEDDPLGMKNKAAGMAGDAAWGGVSEPEWDKEDICQMRVEYPKPSGVRRAFVPGGTNPHLASWNKNTLTSVIFCHRCIT